MTLCDYLFREQLLYKFRENGYSSDLLFDFSIGTDLMNSTWRTISFDQPGLSLSREYMIQGLKNENVRHYFSLMKRTAIAFGANPETVEKELEETLNFEIKLSNASLPKELRRNAFKLYNPMTLADLGHLIPWLDWTEYTNRILTKEIAQVSDNFLKTQVLDLKDHCQFLAREFKSNYNEIIYRLIPLKESLFMVQNI